MKDVLVSASLILLLAVSGKQVWAAMTGYDKETQVTLKGGSAFTISPGWSFDEFANKLQSPERDLTVYIIQSPFSGDAEGMVKAAWKSVYKKINYKILQKTLPPPTDGWEYVQQITYEVPVAENKTVLAVVRVFKGTAFIILVEGSNAAMDRRGPQLQIVVDTWRPVGMKKENLSERKTKKFTQADAAELDRFITQSIDALKIPGTAVAVVQDGKLVYRKGFGLKRLGSQEKIEPDTLFMIGSTTKPLTTLMLAKLVEEGKLQWDTPIYSVLPQFSLADKDVSKKFLIKHAACACTGMPRRDMELVFGSKINSADDMLRQMHSMTPTTGFGETWQYSNQLVATGGYAGAHVYAGGSDLFSAYEEAMRDLVFLPLNMSSTRVKPGVYDLPKLAWPHARGYDGNPLPIDMEIENTLYPIGPAGCIWSNIDDLSKYVLMELRNGKDENGKSLYAEEQILKRRTPGVKVDNDTKYGLGLFIENDKGATVVHHAGDTLGFSSHMMFLPDNGIGMVILCNSSNFSVGGFRKSMKQKLLEVFLGAEPKAKDMIDFAVKNCQELNDKQHERVSISPTDLHWVSDYLGKYHNKDLGPFELAQKDGKIRIITPHWTSDVGSAHEQTGEKLIGLVSPPWLGGEMRVQMRPQRKLIFDDAQVKYEMLDEAAKAEKK